MEVLADTLPLGSYAYLVFLHDLEDNTFSVIGCNHSGELGYRGIKDLDDYAPHSMYEASDEYGNRCKFSILGNSHTQKKLADCTALSNRVKELLEKSCDDEAELEVTTEGNYPILDAETIRFSKDGVTRFCDTDCEEFFFWRDLDADEIELLDDALDNM